MSKVWEILKFSFFCDKLLTCNKTVAAMEFFKLFSHVGILKPLYYIKNPNNSLLQFISLSLPFFHNAGIYFLRRTFKTKRTKQKFLEYNTETPTVQALPLVNNSGGFAIRLLRATLTVPSSCNPPVSTILNVHAT